jgi:hypothetical protein
MAFNIASLYPQETEEKSPVLSSILNKVSGATTNSGMKVNQTPGTSVYNDYLSSTPKTFTPTYGEQNMLSQNLLGQRTADNYNKVLENPLSISVEELLKRHPDAAKWNPEVQQKFAQNYRLGTASINDPSKAWEYSMNQDWRPISDGNKGEVTYTSDGIKYNAIIDPSKIRWDDTYGLITDKDNRTAAKEWSTGLIGGVVDQFGSSPLPSLALLAGVLAPALMGTTATGMTGAASEALAGSLGTTGSIMGDVLGGSITAGGGLGGLVAGAPIGTTLGGVAGGFLNPALAAGAGLGAASGATAGTVGGNFNLPFQSPASTSPVGNTPPVNNTGTGLSEITSTPPDLGTGMITSPEGASGLVNSPPIGTTLGAGTPGTTGGFLNPILGGATIPTTAAAAGLAPAAGFNVTDYLSDLFSAGTDKFMSDPVKNSLTAIGGLSSYLGNKELSSELEKYLSQGLSQSDPFGSQRAQYAAKLKASYDNPNTYLNSPEYKGISKKRLEALERADAAQGRRSQYGARAENMYEFDQENLMKERTMLAQLAGSGIQPSQVSSLLQNLGIGSANAQVNSNGSLLFALNQILGSE